MTVAEKLTKIAKNEPKVYEAGHDAGYTEGINKGGYADGYEQGKKEEYDAFWDAFQDFGNRKMYGYAFFQYGGEMVHPKYKIVPTDASSLNQTFCESKLKKIEAAYFDFSQKPNGTYNQAANYYTFNSSKQLEEIEDIGMCDTLNYYATFGWCSKLHTIAVMRVAESTTFSSVFNGCPKLKNIKIEGTIGQNGLDFSACKELSADSIINIIEHLSLTATGKTLTLSRTAVENADFGGGDNVYVSTGGLVRGAYVHFNPISLKAGDKIRFSIVVADGHHYNNYDWEDPSDWYVGMNPYGGEPTYTDGIYTAQNDEQLNNLMAYVITPSAMTVSFKLRAVLIDDNGNEITGENLAVPITGDFTANDFDYGNVEYTVSEESWETLQASKPNWTITLV